MHAEAGAIEVVGGMGETGMGEGGGEQSCHRNFKRQLETSVLSVSHPRAPQSQKWFNTDEVLAFMLLEYIVR